MGSISKGFLLFVIVILAVSSLIVFKPVYAQVGVTSPSMPDWGVSYETYTIYVPPTYGVDPSTGKAVVTQAGYNEVYRKVRVDIQYQPFVPYNNSNGQLIQLFYDVRWKEHLGTLWEGIPDGIWFTQLSDSPRTGVIIGFKGYKGSEGYMALLDYVPGSQLDFQVKASIGYYTADNVFIGETSGWSNTQTITISDNSTTADSGTSPSPSPGSSPAPSQNLTASYVVLLVVIAVLLGVIAVLLIAVVVLLRKRSAK